jgi:hypothetical protein
MGLGDSSPTCLYSLAGRLTGPIQGLGTGIFVIAAVDDSWEDKQDDDVKKF